MAKSYQAVVAGVSSGGFHALKVLLSGLPQGFTLPLIIVQHIGSYSDGKWISALDNLSPLIVKEADEKETVEKGYVYIAPANYHLLLEKDRTFSLSTEQKVNFARPSIDVLFESAAEVYKDELIGIVLTGSNSDGTRGLKAIKDRGGVAIVQDPATAEMGTMPSSAIASVDVDFILSLDKIIEVLLKLQYPI